MDLSVIVVNWNTKKLLDICLDSIYKFTKSVTFEVIVVDNNSTDGSQEFVKKSFPKVKLIENKDNVGFAKANNQGIKLAKGEYIFLLNSDAYLIENSLEKLVHFAKEKKNLGIVGPLLINEDKSIQQSAGFIPNLLQIFFWSTFLDDLPFGYLLNPYHIDNDQFYRKERKVGWLSGAALLIPKKIIKITGPLDENIFMYGEDVEWCYRIEKSGHNIIFSPLTKIVHIGSGSSGKVSENAFLGEYKGLLYFYKKHKGHFSLQLLRMFLKMGALARIFIFQILGRKELAKVYAKAFKVA